jgi:hypothetical protein
MKVWVCEYSADYEGSTVCGVASNEELAKEWVERQRPLLHATRPIVRTEEGGYDLIIGGQAASAYPFEVDDLPNIG